MRYFLCFIVPSLILSFTSSSLFALACSNFFDGSSDENSSSDLLPLESLVNVEVSAGDLPFSKLEEYYLQYFEGSDIHPGMNKSKSGIRIFSRDPKIDYIRKFILEMITSYLKEFYELRTNYTFLVNDEMYVDEVVAQREKMRAEWGLESSPQWEVFMKTLYQIVNSYSIQKTFGTADFDNPLRMAKYMEELTYPDEDKIVGFDQQIEELISIIWGHMSESEIADWLSFLISELIGEEFSEDRIMKEIKITLRQYLWYIAVCTHFDKVVEFQKLEVEKGLENEDSQKREYISKLGDTLDEMMKNDMTKPLRTVCTAAVVSSNTIITTATCLKKLSWNGKVSIRRGSETVSSVAYYIDPEFFKHTKFGVSGICNNVAIVRFPDGTFDNVIHTKISTIKDPTKGYLVIGKDHKVIKMSKYVPDVDDEGFKKVVSMVASDGLIDPDSKENLEYALEVAKRLASLKGTFKADQTLSKSDLISQEDGAFLFGPDREILGIVVIDGIYNRGIVDSALFKNSKKFLEWIIDFDKKLIIRGINTD